MAHLERSDVILVAGGDMQKGWKVLDDTYIGEKLKWRYYDGAVLIGVGAGASYLGARSWDGASKLKYGEWFSWETLKIVPEVISTKSEEMLVELIEQLGTESVKVFFS